MNKNYSFTISRYVPVHNVDCDNTEETIDEIFSFLNTDQAIMDCSSIKSVAAITVLRPNIKFKILTLDSALRNHQDAGSATYLDKDDLINLVENSLSGHERLLIEMYLFEDKDRSGFFHLNISDHSKMKNYFENDPSMKSLRGVLGACDAQAEFGSVLIDQEGLVTRS